MRLFFASPSVCFGRPRPLFGCEEAVAAVTEAIATEAAVTEAVATEAVAAAAVVVEAAAAVATRLFCLSMALYCAAVTEAVAAARVKVAAANSSNSLFALLQGPKERVT